MGKKATKPASSPVTTAGRDLFAPCGMYCGFCTSYLSLKHAVPRRRGIISYCAGCRPRGKTCSFIKKRCERLLNHEVDSCHECPQFPCNHLERISKSYESNFTYSYDFIQSLKKIHEKGVDLVQSMLHEAHGCERCGEIRCIHNGLCYNCDKHELATMKNYRNEP